MAKAFAKILEKTRPDDRGLSILSVSAASPGVGKPGLYVVQTLDPCLKP